MVTTEKTHEVPTREALLRDLRLELLGPESPDELLKQSPNTRYLVGMLAPNGTAADEAEDEGLEGSAGEGQEDGQVPRAASLDPSSIGISFAALSGSLPITLTATWGEYEKRVREGAAEDVEESTGVERDADPDETVAAKKHVEYDWSRQPIEVTLDLEVAPTGTLEKREIAAGVELQWIARVLEDLVVFSCFLVNARQAPGDRRPPDEDWMYQPQLRVSSTDAAIRARTGSSSAPDPDPDVAAANLLYRDHRELATGHGVAADWTLLPGFTDRASEVRTVVIPDQVVPVVGPAAGEEVGVLEMETLSQAGSSDVRALLGPLEAAYCEWIKNKRAELDSVPQPHRQVGEEHLKHAAWTLGRIREGIELLATDDLALHAFRFANDAMARQLRHSVTVRAKRRSEPPPKIVPAWRPFQIGFILQCLPSIVDGTHKHRSLADLLWFPTGGGKTEAYLGLIAFACSHRRLRPAVPGFDSSAGTTVIMRYTLRLLTIQQFQRALALLCACEEIRESDTATWGTERFTIGLWVGESATPNNYEDSKTALEELKNERHVYEGSPYQILFCPWCGEDIGPAHYRCVDELERTLAYCSSYDCPFGPSSEFGLPALVVDEEIYRNPPSLVLATVDKFARMPFNGRIQALFGRVQQRCPRHGFITSAEAHPQTHRETKAYKAARVEPSRLLAPPDLIIQDELHLISGPLGTLVGLYEVAVQELCRIQGDGFDVVPKVVASTATIRRARRQVEGLFGRDVAVFPPPGLDANDSFFAKSADPDEVPGRRYVGVYAPGKSVKTALVRVYAAMLSRGLAEFEAAPSTTTDAYMTLVGYFNSLRELGGAVRLVEDDVPGRLKVLKRRGYGPLRPIYESQELTSRVGSSQIPARLQQLERTFIDKQQGAYPVDVLLASNMLSVGVDVDRLGLMAVSGQPKTSAEYIQATSRVGRKHPGLIITVFNWIRPRDTSHYERFQHYHETFYRHVEATSVTPFSARARDRALRAVLAAFVRLNRPEGAGERAAGDFMFGDASALRLMQALSARALEATGRDDVRAETELQLQQLVDEWAGLAGKGDPELVYTRYGVGKAKDTRMNLLKAMEQRGGTGVWPAAGSLREVEPEVNVILREGGGA
ncbi:MAG TPA: DISARM system helicase DrmA [Baekduia sp.]|nr:DISARM system helicase DrmA [Baekduia sp.]